MIEGGEVTALEQFAGQDTKPDLDLVHTGSVLGRIVEDDAMRWITQEGGTGLHRLQDTLSALDAQIGGDIRLLGYVAYQRLRLMDVEIVGDKVPPGHRWIGVDRALDVVHKVCLVAG